MLSTVRMKLPAIFGGGLFEVDGVDITRAVRAVSIDHRHDEITLVSVELAVACTEGEIDGEVRAVMSDEVRKALVALGWTAPDG